MMTFIHAVWAIMLELSPWLLVGAAIAGVLHVLMPRDFIRRHLGGRGWMSTVKASVIGVPMPLCSCSVIPTGLGLKRDGAGTGASVSFLTSTPQTGVDSITVTAAFLGWPFALFKVAAALVMGVTGGIASNLLVKDEFDDSSSAAKPTAASSCCTQPEDKPVVATCCGGAGAAVETPTAGTCCGGGGHGAASEEHAAPEAGSCCGGGEDHAAHAESPSSGRFIRGVHFASEELLRMIWRWLVIGVLISAAVTVFVPPGSWPQGGGSGIWAMLLCLVISLPLYVCATASVPIAAALVAAGMPTGAALVFLMAGPATNVATIGAVGRSLGWRAAMVYLANIVIGSVGLGLCYDWLVGIEVLHQHAHAMDHGSWWAIASAVVLLGLLLWYAGSDAWRWWQRRSQHHAALATCH